MIISRLSGGMGNQMFQYALGRSLALKHNTELGLDLTFLLDRTPMPNVIFREYNLDEFNIDATIVSQKDIPLLYRKYNLGWAMRYVDYIRRKLVPSPGREKSDHTFDPAIFSLGPDVYLEGWWQNPRYFEEYADVIRKDFTLKKNPSEKAAALIKDIQSKNSVCVHIRRGDYMNLTHFHPVLDQDYYNQAIKKISEKNSIDCIYVFDRDDIEWCKQHVHFEYPVIYVENDISLAECVTAMSACNHFVIANSSLSWWGAWLGTSPEKMVVAPKQWFADTSVETKGRILAEWITL